jgi:hypothetical protein
MTLTQIGSPNFTAGRSGTKVDRIIVHWMDGTLASADTTFQNTVRQTSAHDGFEDSNDHQYVDWNNTAWHAGDWNMNLRSVGFEHSADPSRLASDATYVTSAARIAQVCKQFGIPCDRAHILKHSQVVSTQCCGTVDIERLVNMAAQELGGANVIAQPSVTPPPAVGDNVVNWTGQVTVTSTANVRTVATTAGNTPVGSNAVGAVIDIVGYTIGQDPYGDGRNVWLKAWNGHWVWAANTNWNHAPAPAQVAQAQGGTVVVTFATLNVRKEPSTGALGGQANTPDGMLHAGNVVTYASEVGGENVSQGGVTTNLWYKSVRGNYFWAGGCRKQ